MPRIILKCGYLKSNSKSDRGGFINYIATREGVVKITNKLSSKKATEKQKDHIKDLIRLYPDIKKYPEYDNYIKEQTIGNASELITRIEEDHYAELCGSKGYLQYIAQRPGVYKQGKHGLFGQEDNVDLEKVKQEINDHQGNVWTQIISLKREDANRLNYENIQSWRNLILKHQLEIAEKYKIYPDHLQWYAAFHDEAHHPHIHMIIYSTDPSEGYLTKKSIDDMRAMYAKDIFKQDLMQIYTEQTATRDKLKKLSNELLNCQPPKEIIPTMIALGKKLESIKGKKTYGYLSKSLKQEVDLIMAQLTEQTEIKKCYQEWCVCIDKIFQAYKDEEIPAIPMVNNKEFRSIKNQIISAAIQLNEESVYIQDYMEEPIEEKMEFIKDEIQADDIVEQEEKWSFWNEDYKQAKKLLYGTKETEKDQEQARIMLEKQAGLGNPLAMYDLGLIYTRGLGVLVNKEQANEWFRMALNEFKILHSERPKSNYFKYRIGVCYDRGYGVEENKEEAKSWYEQCDGYKYADFALGNLYYWTYGEMTDAFSHYSLAADAGMPYACYSTAKMIDDGLAEGDLGQAEKYYKNALDQFISQEESMPDDNLQYRIGTMYLKGKGCQADWDKAKEYLKKSTENKNDKAQNLLMRCYLKRNENETEVMEAIQYFQAKADGGSHYLLGQAYAEGKLGLKIDKERAFQYFVKADSQGLSYATYQLAKCYELGVGTVVDLQQAQLYYKKALDRFLIEYAKRSSDQLASMIGLMYALDKGVEKNPSLALEYLQKVKNKSDFVKSLLAQQFILLDRSEEEIQQAVQILYELGLTGDDRALFTLGRIYHKGLNHLKIDRDLARVYYTQSAGLGNEYAKLVLQYFDRIHEPAEVILLRLIKHMSKIFQNEVHRNVVSQSENQLKLREKRLKIALGHNIKDSVHN